MNQMQKSASLVSAAFRRPALRYALMAAGAVAAIVLAFAVYANRPISVRVAAVELGGPLLSSLRKSWLLFGR